MIKADVKVYGVTVPQVSVRVKTVVVDYKNKVSFTVQVHTSSGEELPAKSYEIEYQSGNIIAECYEYLMHCPDFIDPVEI